MTRHEVKETLGGYYRACRDLQDIKTRIDKAKNLLENSNLSIKEICVSCGYTDPNYFSRSFKKNVGVTPTEYKERC